MLHYVLFVEDGAAGNIVSVSIPAVQSRSFRQVLWERPRKYQIDFVSSP